MLFIKEGVIILAIAMIYIINGAYRMIKQK
jgi:hypothetical protein